MAEDVPGFYSVAEEDVVLVGVREVDPAEEERLAASDVAVVSAELMEHGGLRVLAKALDTLRTRVGRVYVHLDLDVLDAGKVGRANSFAPEGGLSAEELEMALGEVRKRFAVAAAGIASYDPAFDSDGRVLRAAVACVSVLTSPAGPAV
jgi:arginase